MRTAYYSTHPGWVPSALTAPTGTLRVQLPHSQPASNKRGSSANPLGLPTPEAPPQQQARRAAQSARGRLALGLLLREAPLHVQAHAGRVGRNHVHVQLPHARPARMRRARLHQRSRNTL